MKGLWRVPTNSEFVGALAVTTVVLVCTSVVMTQKPAWMVGQEESLVKPVGAVGSSSQSRQAKATRWQSLASVQGPVVAPSAEDLGKFAVEEAAAHPGGLQHLDDYYVPVAPGRPTVNPAGQSSTDTKVPATAVQSSVYPLLGGFAVSTEQGSASDAFKRELKADGLSTDGVATFSGGYGPNESPLSRGIGEIAGGDDGFESNPLDPGAGTSWAMYMAVFLVLVGLIVLLAYYLLPQGAFSRSFWEDWTTEHGRQTYYPEGGDAPAGDDAWSRSFEEGKTKTVAAGSAGQAALRTTDSAGQGAGPRQHQLATMV